MSPFVGGRTRRSASCHAASSDTWEIAATAVSAAKTADASAQNCQEASAVFMPAYPDTANFTANSTDRMMSAGEACSQRPVKSFIRT